MVLAIEAIQKDPQLSARAAAKIYDVSRSTLGAHLKGISSRRDTMPNSRKLTDLEEKTIAEYVLDLDARSFPPRLCDVEDMANRLPTATRLQSGNAGPQTSSSDNQSSRRVLRVELTIRGPNAKILTLFGAGFGLCGIQSRNTVS
jgi:hypothetical protein